MAIVVKTNNPSELLSKIKKNVDDNSIQTWSYDSDGDFTHSPDQWKHKGWLQPVIKANKITFNFLGNTKVITTKTIYAVYHGRFIEMLLNHFDLSFDEVYATSLPTNEDRISSSVEDKNK